MNTQLYEYGVQEYFLQSCCNFNPFSIFISSISPSFHHHHGHSAH